ncbi:hypothetical protein [Micromonospora endolithica]|nr:hypothetical protein [Micromonospora endolithica]TWJ25149.1 hypothetical protein JD76_05312 [Micromonospora endolithica]
MVENSPNLQRIQRIRGYYHDQMAPGQPFFADAAAGGRDPMAAP